VKKTSLSSGDTILLMSDGLPELINQEKEIYGYKRARNKFEEIAELDSASIIDHLKEEESKWVNGNDPDDDVTFVVLKVK
jgi:serine phosphatase RsbU (regulator of sigma subunit)